MMNPFFHNNSLATGVNLIFLYEIDRYLKRKIENMFFIFLCAFKKGVIG